MAGFASNVGKIIDVATGSKGKNTIERLTKNPALEKFNLDSQADYSKTKTASAESLDQYIRDFLAGSPAAATRTGQETAAIDRYYNGDVDRALAELRTKQAAANNEALNRALQYATRSQNLDRITGGGGNSSYNRQLALRTGSDLSLNSLLQNIAQQRADEEYMRQSQLGLAGRRTSMADALAGRALVPGAARKAELGWSLGTIGSLLQNDQANNMYGVKYNPSTGETFAQFGKNDWNDVKDLVGMGTGVLSAYMGGSGYQPQQQGNTAPVSATSWSPAGAPYAAPAPATGGWGGGSYALPPMGSMYSSIPYGYAPPNFATAPGLSLGSNWGL